MGASGQAGTKNDRVAVIGTIIVAIIGCISAVTVAGIQPFAGWIMSRTPIPTDYIPPVVAAINTPLPPTATLTEEPAEISKPAGEDWIEDCIQSKQWKIYPALSVATDDHGCYQQPVWNSMYTRDYGLSILAQPKALISSVEYGIFTQLPQRGNVSVSLNLDVVDNGQVWFGIFSAPDIHGTDGVLLVAPPGDTKNHAFALKYLSPNNTVKSISISKVYSNASGIYQLGFNLQYGAITAIVEDRPFTLIPFTSTTRWLFIGYRAKLNDPNGNVDIQALFSNLVIK